MIAANAHPRIRQRIAGVTANREKNLATDLIGCIAALDNAIDQLTALKDGAEAEKVEVLIGIYEWARGELKAAGDDGRRQAERIAIVVRLLQRIC